MMICVSLAAGYRANRVAGTPGLVQERRLRARSAPREVQRRRARRLPEGWRPR